jgi:hypothetical protein
MDKSIGIELHSNNSVVVVMRACGQFSCRLA